ncbi:MAG TPA: hypothetical protein VFK37_06035 [Bacillales bacterium]|nr:hypothetical protein [Bacillales bacterium]
MLNYNEEEKLRRLLQIVPEPEEEPMKQTSARHQNRDELGQFAPKAVESKSKLVRWVAIDDHTYLRQEWPLWSDICFITVILAVSALVF